MEMTASGTIKLAAFRAKSGASWTNHISNNVCMTLDI